MYILTTLEFQNITLNFITLRTTSVNAKYYYQWTLRKVDTMRLETLRDVFLAPCGNDSLDRESISNQRGAKKMGGDIAY